MNKIRTFDPKPQCGISIHRSVTTSLILMLILSSCGSTSPQQHRPAQPNTPAITPTVSNTPALQLTTVPQTTPTPTPQPPTLQHIIYIMMENHSTNQILGNTADAPYLNQLAHTYGVLAHYYGVTHPSLPNYLAAISGNFQGIWDDCPAGSSVICAPQAFASLLSRAQYINAATRPHLFGGQTIVDQLETHNLTWKAYMQSMPSTAFTGASYGLYAQKHDPFMYFSSIRNNPARMQRIVPLTQFDLDIQSGKLPNFAWISPDACNDMHGAPGCSAYDALIAQGDYFVHIIVQKIMHSPLWQQGSAIVVVWDENYAGISGCCNSPVGVNGVTLGGADVPAIVISSNVPQHIVLSNAPYNHYSLLATIESIWNVGCLANTCAFNNSTLMTKLFT